MTSEAAALKVMDAEAGHASRLVQVGLMRRFDAALRAVDSGGLERITMRGKPDLYGQPVAVAA